MADLASAVAGQPAPNGMRIGTVVSVSPLEIDVQGGLITNAGVLADVGLDVGAAVALYRQDDTWIVWGSTAPAPVPLLTRQFQMMLGGPTQTVGASVQPVLGPGGVAITVSIPKRHAATSLRCDLQVTCYGAGVTAAPLFDVKVSGVTGALAGQQLNIAVLQTANLTSNEHTPMSGSLLIPELDAGPAVVALEWLSSVGSARMDANDMCTLTVAEVWS